jgi:hypothetical protein
MLIQLAFALVVLSILAAGDLTKQFNEKADVRVLAVATGLDVARNAGNDYVASYYDRINAKAAGQPITVGAVTVANAVAPTVAELVQLGKMPPNSTGTALIPGSSYKFFITTNPTSCALPSTPGSLCNLEGLVCIDTAFTTKGKIDYGRLGLAIRKLGADGGYSTFETPAIVSGLGGTWSVANPIAATAKGILCTRFGYSSSAFAQFVRKDGTVSMTGNFNVGGNSINNVLDVTSTGTVKSGKFLTDVKLVGTPCSDVGALASGDKLAMVCDGVAWQVAGSPRAAPGIDCGAQQGVTAVSTVTGETLVCKSTSLGNKYVKLVSLVGKKVLIASAVVQDGSVVTMPTCDVGGVPDFSFDATQVTLDLTTSPPKQTMYWTATNASATTWAVKIRLKDNFGAEVSGNTVGLSNIINLECRY